MNGPMLEAFGPTVILVSALAGGLLLCGWVVWHLFSMYMMREINGPEVALMGGVFAGLLASAIAAASAGSIGLFVLVFILGASFPAMQALGRRRRLSKLERQDIAAYLAALRQQPDVPFPHRRLGEIYQAGENWDKAVEHYQAYLEMHEHSADVARKLERCLVRKRRQDLGLLRCPKCGADNPRKQPRCTNCGFYLRGSQEIVDALAAPGTLRALRWVIIIAVPLGTILSFVEAVHPVLAVLLLFAGVLAALIYWYVKLTR